MLVLPVCPTPTYNAVHALFNVPFHTPNTSKNIKPIDISQRIKFMNGVMDDGGDLKRFSIYPVIIPASNQLDYKSLFFLMKFFEMIRK